MEAQNHSLFKDLLPGLAFSLGLGLEAVPTVQQAKATCFYTVHIAQNRTHLSWGPSLLT